MEEALSIIQKLAAGGLATLLIAILIAGQKRIWVWGYHLDDTIRDRDKRFEEMVKEKDKQLEREREEKEAWRKVAWEAHRLTERSVTAVAKVVEP